MCESICVECVRFLFWHDTTTVLTCFEASWAKSNKSAIEYASAVGRGSGFGRIRLSVCVFVCFHMSVKELVRQKTTECRGCHWERLGICEQQLILQNGKLHIWQCWQKKLNKVHPVWRSRTVFISLSLNMVDKYLPRIIYWSEMKSICCFLLSKRKVQFFSDDIILNWLSVIYRPLGRRSKQYECVKYGSDA